VQPKIETGSQATNIDRRALFLAAAGASLAPHAAAAAQPTLAPMRILPAQYEWPPIPPQAPVREGLAPLPDVRLWFWDTGGPGEPIVLLHPGTGSSASWIYQQPVFAAAGLRVIAYSRRGHGLS